MLPLNENDYIKIAEQIVLEYGHLVRYKNGHYHLQFNEERIKFDPHADKFEYYNNEKLEITIQNKDRLAKLKRLMVFFNQ